MKLAAVALLALLLPSIAHANDEPDTRDPGNALALSIAGTFVGAAVLIPTGSMKNEDWKVGIPLLALAEVLPSVGHFYAGNYVSPGLVTRLVGGAMIVIALKDPFESDQIVSGNARALGISGMLLTLGGTVYDIATAGREARRYNARTVSVTPAIATSEGMSPGFAVAGRF
jgi:uncharacterized membrane protein YfcA